MDIYMIWGQLKTQYPGQYAPDLIDAWSEYVIDDNQEGWRQPVANAEANEEYETVRVIRTTVSAEAIDDILNNLPAVSNSGLSGVE